MKYIIIFMLITSNLMASQTTESIATILQSKEYSELESDLKRRDFSGYHFSSLRFQSRSYRSNGRGDEELRQKYLIVFDHNFYVDVNKEYIAEIVTLNIKEGDSLSHIKIIEK